MVLIASLSWRISPRTSTVIFFDKSPFATAMVTSAMLRTCAVKLPAIMFTLSVKSFQVPATPGTTAWPPSLPSVPTSRATRVTSPAKASSCLTMALTIFAVLRNSPRRGCPSASSATVSVRLPLATAPMTRAISAVGRTKFSFTADGAADPFHFLGAVRHHLYDVVQCVRDFAIDAAPTGRQAHREISLLHSGEGLQQKLCVEPFVVRSAYR